MKQELLLGCGYDHTKRIHLKGTESTWNNLTTLDNNPDCNPDFVFDLYSLHRNGIAYDLPFASDTFDEIHAYHVLEHIGAQGDFRTFFAQFSEFWRILKPGGYFCGIVPSPTSPWIFGDPGHTRVIHPNLLTFLDQTQYTNQVGKTNMSDYRRYYKTDFNTSDTDKAVLRVEGDEFIFCIPAVKPSRIEKCH